MRRTSSLRGWRAGGGRLGGVGVLGTISGPVELSLLLLFSLPLTVQFLLSLLTTVGVLGQGDAPVGRADVGADPSAEAVTLP